MQYLSVILCLIFLGTIIAQDSDFEVVGPLFVESSTRDARTFRTIHIPEDLMEEFSTSVIQPASDSLHRVENFGHSAVLGIQDEASKQLDKSKAIINNAASSVSTSINSAAEEVGSAIEGAAVQTKYVILKSTSDAKGFFTSGFNKLKTWFTEIEDEAKELVHFILRIIEIAAVLAILAIFIWITRRVLTGYRLVKGVVEHFELNPTVEHV